MIKKTQEEPPLWTSDDPEKDFKGFEDAMRKVVSAPKIETDKSTTKRAQRGKKRSANAHPP